MPELLVRVNSNDFVPGAVKFVKKWCCVNEGAAI